MSTVRIGKPDRIAKSFCFNTLQRSLRKNPYLKGRPEPCFWSRFDTAQAFADFSDPFRPPCSQRDYAEQHGIPRSTLGYWLREEFPDHLDKDFVAFFRSPPGQAFLRRLLLSVLLVFHHRNPCGLHAVSQFLELVDLHHFVGASYGACTTWISTCKTTSSVSARKNVSV